MTEDELAKLRKRVADGIEWLSSHDQEGAFHFWYTSGILPGHPKPAQSPERQAEYRAYYDARRLWERLDTQLAKVDPLWGRV